MAFGLEVYDANGKLQLEIGSQYFGRLGVLTLPARIIPRTINSQRDVLTIPTQSGYRLWAMNPITQICHINYLSETQIEVFRYPRYYSSSNSMIPAVDITYGIFI